MLLFDGAHNNSQCSKKSRAPQILSIFFLTSVTFTTKFRSPVKFQQIGEKNFVIKLTNFVVYKIKFLKALESPYKVPSKQRSMIKDRLIIQWTNILKLIRFMVVNFLYRQLSHQIITTRNIPSTMLRVRDL